MTNINQTFCPPKMKFIKKKKKIFIEKYIHVGKMRNLMNRQMHADVYNKNAS